MVEVRVSREWCYRVNDIRKYNGLGRLTQCELQKELQRIGDETVAAVASQILGLEVILSKNGFLIAVFPAMGLAKVRRVATLIYQGTLHLGIREIQHQKKTVYGAVLPLSLRAPFLQASNLSLVGSRVTRAAKD